MERKSRSYGITNTLKRTLLITSLILKANIEPETILPTVSITGILEPTVLLLTFLSARLERI